MLNSDIRDQAYLFFIEEAPELLEAIETGLLALRDDRSTARVHEIMRAAHSIKGGAASVELDAIKEIAHRLETIFKALYDQTVEIDTTLESALLQAYDCLRLPLTEQIETGGFDIEQALGAADAAFSPLEQRLEAALQQADSYIPTSSDLGIDMVASIFEVDVAQGIDRLAAVLQQPQAYPIAGEIQAQAEVFIGLAELLELPGFGEIAQTALTALEQNPDRALEILRLALADFEAGRNAVLAGDRSQGGAPSAELLALTQQASLDTEVTVIEWDSDELIDPAADSFSEFLPVDLLGEELLDWTLAAPELTLDLTTETMVPPAEPLAEPLAEPELAANPEVDWTKHGADLNPEDIWRQDQAELEDQDEQPATVAAQEGGADRHAVPYPDRDLDLEAIWNTDALEPLDTGSTAELESPEPEDYEAIGDPESIWHAASVEDLGAIDWTAGETDSIDSLNASAEKLFSETLSESFSETQGEASSGPEHHSVIGSNRAATEAFTSPSAHQTNGDPKPDILNLGFTSLSEAIDPQPLDTAVRLDRSDLPPASIERGSTVLPDLTPEPPVQQTMSQIETAATPEIGVDRQPESASVDAMIQAAIDAFDQLPPLSPTVQPETAPPPAPAEAEAEQESWKQYLRPTAPSNQSTPVNLSVRVDMDRLERMNNLVGELAISRNSLSLQNEQLQGSVSDLVERFERFQGLIQRLQDLSDQMLVTPANRPARHRSILPTHSTTALLETTPLLDSFDTLEMDRYSGLHFQLQEIFEQTMQLEEALGDVSLFAGQSNQTLGQQRQQLSQLQNELMWARMLPLGNVLNRFPRVLRDLSTKYGKTVSLKLNGTGVLVDKVVLEKLYDPLLHLLRNAFDHGIEMPDVRHTQGKARQGTIEIRAYHRGNQTLIEITDDGKGLDAQRIGQRAIELGWLTVEELENLKPTQLLDFIFEPGFSTAAQVSELSGRGVGLDVVRAQLRSLKGTVSVHSTAGQGTTFRLSIPLTLTIAKLLTCSIGNSAVAVPSDSVEEIIVPQSEQLRQSGAQRFLYWREQLVPIYRMANLLDYACTVPANTMSQALTAVPTPQDWALPLLVIKRAQHSFAIEVDRLITEQELVIKPFGAAISPPAYTYGCTILGDGNLVPVIDAAALVDLMLEPTGLSARSTALPAAIQLPASALPSQAAPQPRQVRTILVVDDSSTLRRMLALTLEKSGYRVLQARDGQEALSQLQQAATVQLVICDIEMPNMNGFEFLSQRRQQPDLSTIPVVMLTSRNNDKHRRLAMQLGATDYFSKPYIEQNLLQALEAVLSQASAISIG